MRTEKVRGSLPLSDWSYVCDHCGFFFYEQRGTNNYSVLKNISKWPPKPKNDKSRDFTHHLNIRVTWKKAQPSWPCGKDPKKRVAWFQWSRRKKKESPNGAKGWGWGTAAWVDRLALVTDRWHFRVSAGTVARGMSAALSRDGRVKDLMGCLAHLGCRAR